MSIGSILKSPDMELESKVVSNYIVNLAERKNGMFDRIIRLIRYDFVQIRILLCFVPGPYRTLKLGHVTNCNCMCTI